MTFGASIIPVMFMAGMAIDYSDIVRERSRLQETADSSALYAVKELEKPGFSENDLQLVAEKVIESNFDIDGEVSAVVELDKVANLLTVSAVKPYTPAFLQLMRPGPVHMHVSATVDYGEVIEGLSCILTLRKNGRS